MKNVEGILGLPTEIWRRCAKALVAVKDVNMLLQNSDRSLSRSRSALADSKWWSIPADNGQLRAPFADCEAAHLAARVKVGSTPIR